MRSETPRRRGDGEQIAVTPGSAGWEFLAFSVHHLRAGDDLASVAPGRETAIVPLEGELELHLDGAEHRVARRSVFEELAPVGYVSPGAPYAVHAVGDGVVAIGSAPAEGRYPTRLLPSSAIRAEVRGGGAALRQVNHTLAPPIEAERLILYEVFVPRGTWSGWPPHRHDGVDGSPYLEEVYYFRLDRPEGFWVHRNFSGPDDETAFDEVVVGGDGDAALVPYGYHSSVACPGANMYILNFLAGRLVGEERGTPPCFHADHTWIESDWDAGRWDVPRPLGVTGPR